jgi:hypothetical protein
MDHGRADGNKNEHGEPLMVKITSPLMSRFARGTLGSTLQFRGGPGGTIGLARPTPKKTTPLALVSNGVIVQFCTHMMQTYQTHKYLAYETYAAEHVVTNRAAYLHFCLEHWRNGQMIPLDDPELMEEAPAPAATISVDGTAPAGTPDIAITTWPPESLWTIHVLFSPTEIPGPKNCYRGFHFESTEQLTARPDVTPGTVWLQVQSWYFASVTPSLSNKLELVI